MTRKMWQPDPFPVAVAFVLIVLATGGSDARGAQPDSALVTSPSQADSVVTSAPSRLDSLRKSVPSATAVPAFGDDYLSVIPHEMYLQTHSVNLDNYLERVYSHMLVREGPIGRDAATSRWGIGRGRALVLLNGVEFNDPQNGVAPLGHFPVSGLHEMALDTQSPSSLVHPHSIEGSVEIREVGPPETQAHTFIELSNGDDKLRQRRLRFGSKRANVGIDFGYDEVLNDGYSFDASGQVGTNDPEYGKSESRHVSTRVRGEFDDGSRYSIGFRRYRASSNGDLVSALNNQERSGHLATIQASTSKLEFTLFERGFDVNDPDSNTVNSTRGAYATFHAVRVRDTELLVKAGIEDIASEQRVGGGVSQSTLRRITGSAEGGARFTEELTLRVHGEIDAYWGYSTGWGIGGDLNYDAGRHDLSVGIRRTYRMPALGELFLPQHVTGGITFAGNSNVADEHAWEAMGRATSKMGPLTNVLRLGAIRVEDAIAFLPTQVGGETWRVAGNGDSGSVGLIDEHLRIDARLAGFMVIADGGLVWSGGDKKGFFQSTPDFRTAVGLRIGHDFFQNTSALYVGGDYQYTTERTDYQGVDLPTFGVLNVYLEGRLVDAHLYIGMMNALDESYQTLGGYLMTPRTFVYGVSWLLFD